MVAIESSYPRQAAVNAKHTGEMWVLIPEHDGAVVVVNETGYQVFSRCDGTRGYDCIASEIAQKYGADRESVGRDVAEFAQQLEAAGLLSH
jgi:hypothetical protein